MTIILTQGQVNETINQKIPLSRGSTDQFAAGITVANARPTKLFLVSVFHFQPKSLFSSGLKLRSSGHLSID